MSEETTIYLSIGSNLGNRFLNIQKAIFQFNTSSSTVDQVSLVYENPAVGFAGEDFLNACFSIRTSLSAEELLELITKIEHRFGRERSSDGKQISRTIDLDILYYGKAIIATDSLVIPHPRMTERNFVLKPLADIAPQFYHPSLKKDTRNLLQECKDISPLTKYSHKLYPFRKALFNQLQFLAIEGNIGAGKTTLTKMIADDFNGKLVLERFADNAFLPKFYEDQQRYAFPLEMSFLADRYQQFTDDTSQFDLFKKFMVSDYDIFKSLIFAKVTLQKEEFELYKKVFNFMYKEVKKPDIYVYLYQSTERLLSNIKRRGRDYEQGITADYLDKINRGYLDFIKGHPQQTTLLIDLGNLDFVANKTDYEYILESIETKLIEILP
ncbi:2-amino-4-hydroxy-6-hydroxymethyldihydropteridine diphosphokinase [Croceitalea rosinachiae]|uniref:2-amino-4-hydroxy-6-hydroxymethyldihydropteridine pyrophosphokinase n=1 Tax=Croceitalea rosinachiae TaxID=3075596 RepID=A0ABU3A618_9FLAO|nr:2-amino-4-hydroxy-6-hydroxymethyldihydropteridine diphosphokinase [Croceitalea sp. F388]MDT0605616.1 2-amino-4-hydroxy-6-hydroxymethyldihydropteridine diphosphokinase [Croceitalea sp. F388]